MTESDRSLDIFFVTALRLWVAVTALVCLGSTALYASVGVERFFALIRRGPLSITEQTLVCVAIVWLSYGVGLALLQRPRLRAEHGVAIACSILILLLYVNILRERTAYGDVADYVTAAFDLHDGRPLHHRYVYPPLLATLCQPFLILGERGLSAAFWAANLLSLVAFFWLLKAVLVRYGFGRQVALGLALLFMVVNVPILRTLGYVQVNLHVINLIFLTILWFPRHRILSALALAVAVHLKASPLVLALPFFWERDRRWILSFVAGLMGLASLTAASYGWGPFVDFYHNACSIYTANGIAFRETSVDSFVRSTGALLGVDSSALVGIFKLPILVLIFLTSVYNVRHSTFSAGKEPGRVIHNSVLMVLASPLSWEHHPVFLALPFLLILRKLDTPAAWSWFGLAYLLEFLMPTFDFYPWSFGRLISPIILTVLMYGVARKDDSALFLGVRDRLAPAAAQMPPPVATST
jgi:hypothetical protein